MMGDAREPERPEDFRDNMPAIYVCECPVVVQGEAWWTIAKVCPEHGKPVAPGPNELEPLPPEPEGGWDCDFWIL